MAGIESLSSIRAAQVRLTGAGNALWAITEKYVEIAFARTLGVFNTLQHKNRMPEIGSLCVERVNSELSHFWMMLPTVNSAVHEIAI